MGFWNLAETLSSWDYVTLTQFSFLVLLKASLARPVRTGLIQLYFAHCPLSWDTSQGMYWHKSKCQSAKLEGHLSHLCQEMKDASLTRRKRIHSSAWAPFYHPSGRTQNFCLYLFSKEVFQLHLAKVTLLFFPFILTASLRYDLHAMKTIHFECTIQ